MNRYFALNLWQRLALLVSLTISTALPAYAAADAADVPDTTTPARSGSADVLVGVRTGTGAALDGPAAAGSIVAGLVERVDATAQIHVLRLPGEALPADLEGAQSSVADVQVYRLRLPAGAEVAEAIATLSAEPGVVYAEPDPVAHIVADPPTDPLYATQWGLSRIHAPGAWATVTGSPEVTIAVIDSGIDAAHLDLAGQLWVNPGEIAGNGLDDDNNGHIDDIHGWNIYGDNADLSDTTGHGTQVAGVIAAAANNGAGVVGVCWGCRLMIVKVTQPGGVANYSDIAAGIAYAASKGAEVINLSLGGSSDSATLRAAVAAAAQTAVVVGGAGNDDAAAPFYPAAYDEALAVAGTDASDVKTSTSNYGPWVDVTAPGEAITTTLSGGGYGAASGTSVAAPFASGLAGLLRSQHPDWSAALTRAQITHTAVNVDAANPGLAGQMGSGRVDVTQAVSIVPAPEVVVAESSVNGQPRAALPAGRTSTVAFVIRSSWGRASSVTGSLVSGTGAVTISKGSATWGAVEPGASVLNTNDPFEVVVAPGAIGVSVPLTLTLAIDGSNVSIPMTLTTETATTQVGGAISSDTLWTAGQIYQVVTSLYINPGVTLTIEPGTVIRFDANRALSVAGTLIADGTQDHPIVFTSSAETPEPGDWGVSTVFQATGGIVFLPSSTPAAFDLQGSYQSGSILRNAIVEYSKGIAVDAAPYIANNVIQKNGWGYGAVFVVSPILGDSGQPVIEHNTICFNIDSPVRLFYRAAMLRQNLICANTGAMTSVARYGAASTVISNTITGNGISWIDNSATIYATYDNATTPFVFAGNNILSNPTPLTFVLESATAAVDLAHNFWGVTDPAIVAQGIVNAPTVPPVAIEPLLVLPNPEAPSYVTTVAIGPSSPIGIQRATLTLSFSAPMDQSIDPTVTFGQTAPYTDTAVVDNAVWLTATTWRATYDFTSLNARSAYTVRVSGARGLDGLTIPADTRFGFTVDYAGQITDQTSPVVERIVAGGGSSGAGSITAIWLGSDPDSSITGYRYAIGTAPGSADVVSWTETTSPRLSRTGLGLTPGQTYWLSVQARNVGGLWSNVALDGFTAGQPLYWVNLPQVRRP